ncbi:MAG: hypothetical protein GXO84_09680 [Chlorobi bacterium]|nr:hypothetical protein [Chlorobiota bacterium]
MDDKLLDSINNLYSLHNSFEGLQLLASGNNSESNNVAAVLIILNGTLETEINNLSELLDNANRKNKGIFLIK